METTGSNLRHSAADDHTSSNQTRRKLAQLFHQTASPAARTRGRALNRLVLVLTVLAAALFRQSSGACQPKPPCESCAALSTVADPSDCTKYFTCSMGGVYAPQMCNRGIYSSQLHTCVSGDKRTCRKHAAKTTTVAPPARTTTKKAAMTRRTTVNYLTRRTTTTTTTTSRPIVVEPPLTIGGRSGSGINSGKPV